MFLRLEQYASESQLLLYPTLHVYLPSLSLVSPKYLGGLLKGFFFETENNMINMLLLGFFF